MNTPISSYPSSGKLRVAQRASGITIKRLWQVWIAILVVTFLVQLSTLDVLPHIQQDEAQITDYGRLALHPHSDWSVTWRVADGKPLLLWSYLGPLIAETSYQMFGPSGIGPRIASVFGGLFAATMALGWLLARKVPVYAALGLATAFLLDPLFVLSQRMARVDSWVMALCLAACWILYAELNNERTKAFRWRIMAAGGLAGMAALVWPSAVFLYPLILLEILRAPRASRTASGKWRSIRLNLLVFLIGGALALVVLLLPILPNLVVIFNDMTTMVSQNVDASKTLQERFISVFDPQQWEKMLRAFVKTFSPVFPLLALVGLVAYQKKGPVLVSALALTMIFASLVYEFRVLYLIPYFILLGSGLFIKAGQIRPVSLLRKIATAVLTVLVLWSAGTSLLLRTALGYEGKAVRDRSKIQEAAMAGIGPGDYNVYLGFTYEFYFAGRSLGWDVYTPYIQYTYDKHGNWIRLTNHVPDSEVINLLSQMDYAIFQQEGVSEELERQLAESGLGYSGALHLGNEQPVKQKFRQQSRNRDVLLWFLQGKESYGSYLVYSRDKALAKSQYQE